ncbi:PCDBD protein, partial [Poecile atricapillus]|nr:PCDBD protein [Poecile atricapillus]
KPRKSEDPLPGRAVALIIVLCVSGMRAESARYSVPEEGERGSFVANIAKDLGLTGEELLARQARLVPEGEKQYLQLNQHTGDLVVREQMDREELCGQSEPCLVRFEVLLENPLQSFRAEVRLTDINDNSPVFLNKEIVLKIPESALPGTRFLLESAHDPDVGNNSLQHYSISSNEYFLVYSRRRSDGRRYAELVLDRALDREQQAEVAFSITAVDGGTPPRSGTALIRVIVLDVNDNIPVFSQTLYKVSVMENSSQDTIVVVVSASDLDSGTNGEIVYSIVQNSEENLETFEINPETGQIRLKKPLDYEEKKTYEIDVQALDGGGLSTHCNVEVQVKDVNDNAPEVIITSLTSTLSEAAPPNTVVALFNVRDRDSGDNGRTACELTGEQPFRITLLAADAYALVTSETLDREQVEEYNVTVRARDEGSPPLSASKTLLVRLLDVNDNAPTFTQAIYTMVISENEPAGRSLGRLSATDPDAGENSRVRYALVRPLTGTLAAASFVTVDAESGIVRSLRPLDYEKVPSFEVTVSAADGGSPPLSAQANAWLSYELAKATEPGLFRVGLHSGEVRTARAVSERDAARQKLILLVLVRDNGKPPLSATAAVSALLLKDLSDVRLPGHGSPAPEDQGGSLTTYLIIALVCVSLLFLVSTALFVARKVCKRKELKAGHVLYGADNLQSGLGDGAAAGSLPRAYCYEISLTTGSGNSEFKFLKPILPSLPPQHCAVGQGPENEQHFPCVPVSTEDTAPDNPGTLSAGHFNSL